MARRYAGWSTRFRNDAQLKRYCLDGVVSTDKTLGVGSYGSVVEVEYRQVSCAAKRMHELLLNPGNQGVREIIQKYRQECQLMYSLRHPNITLFLGLCFLEGSELPLLVMEKLEMSVDDLLECAPNIPLLVKISILIDTCSGLVYLHCMPSPIVHRDLTARNVLLTSSLSAKITDMGNSRIVNLRPDQLAQTLSKNPGAIVYMPPEALNESHRYGPSLDIFSFGHLALYCLTQVFPGELLSATHIDPRHPGEVVGRSEVKRREVYMKKLENLLLRLHPILVELVTNCLHNNPERRPTAQQLLSRLQSVKEEVETLYGTNLAGDINVADVLQLKEIKAKDNRIEELEISEVRLEAENAELTETNTRLENERRRLESANLQISREKNQVIANNSQLETDIGRVQTEKNTAIAENNQLKTENNQLKTENNQLKTENNQLKTENNQLHSTKSLLEREKLQLESLHQQEKQSLQMEVERLTRELQRATPVSDDERKGKLKIATFPLQLDWRRGPDMPVAMCDYIQSVEINGTVYVGGGGADRDEDDYIVMAYNTQSCQWHTLPPYSIRWFAMTVINNKLVLVGGRNRDASDSSELGEWQPDSNQWTHPFPSMSKPRWDPSATSYKHWLVVVAGGCHGYCLQAGVEVLDVSNMQWSTGPSTPTPWATMKSTTLGDTWYLMGGSCDDVGYSPDVYSVSLESLVSQSSSHSSTIWRKLPSLNCSASCPLNIGGSLLAVAGQDMKSLKTVSTIQRYVPETDTWVQAGQLPHAVEDCTCIMTSDKIHIMGGHDGKNGQKIIFTSNIL